MKPLRKPRDLAVQYQAHVGSLSSLAHPTSKSFLSNEKSMQSDETTKMYQDLDLLSRKMTELSPPGFVSSVRSSVDGQRHTTTPDGKDSKLRLLENVISKIIDLDRIVLRQTDPADRGNASKSRAARGMDLNTIPTHLHIVDRLLDLHVQHRRNSLFTVQQSTSPRSAVVGSPRISVSQPSPKPPPSASIATTNNTKLTKERERELISQTQEQMRQKYETEVLKVKLQLQASETSSRMLQERLEKAQAESNALSRKLEQMSVPPPLSPIVKASPQSPHLISCADKAEIESLRRQLKQAQDSSRTLEERLEVAAANEQTVVTELLSIAKALREERGSLPTLPSGPRNQLPENVLGAVRSLGEATLDRCQRLQDAVRSAEASRVMAENELSSITLQRDLVTKDLYESLMKYDALRTAYQEMEKESRNMEVTIAKLRGEKRAERAFAEDPNRADITRDALEKLQADLREATMKVSAIPALEKAHRELQLKISDGDLSQISLHTQIRELRTELEGYKELSESLKSKIRGFGVKENKQFLDTYEEVMREEMMAMKRAFEAKLQAAKEEIETISRKHKAEFDRKIQGNKGPIQPSK